MKREAKNDLEVWFNFLVLNQDIPKDLIRVLKQPCCNNFMQSYLSQKEMRLVFECKCHNFFCHFDQFFGS